MADERDARCGGGSGSGPQAGNRGVSGTESMDVSASGGGVGNGSGNATGRAMSGAAAGAPANAPDQPAAAAPNTERTHPRLLELLVCPLTKTTLAYDEKAQELISRAAGLAYPIRNGVPLLTAEAARQLDDHRGSPPPR